MGEWLQGQSGKEGGGGKEFHADAIEGRTTLLTRHAITSPGKHVHRDQSPRIFPGNGFSAFLRSRHVSPWVRFR